MPADYEELEARIGYTFVDRDLLLRALTHKSVHSEAVAGGPPVPDNEKLEFLGDSILGFVASDYLFRLCPQCSEGMLSRLKSLRVSSAHLFKISSGLGIGQYLQLGRGEEQSGGRAKRAILANALEALIAAIFLDGGLGPSRSFVERLIVSQAEPLDDVDEVALDAKSALQEFAQARRLPVPRYQIVEESGPEHAKLFTVEARVGRQFAARAEGASKKVAGQQAATVLLSRLRSLPELESLQLDAGSRAAFDAGQRDSLSAAQGPEAP